MNISKTIFEKLKKMLKIADFANFGLTYFSQTSSFTYIFELWILYDADKHQ